MKRAGALAVQARHCLLFAVADVQGRYGRYMADFRVMHAGTLRASLNPHRCGRRRTQTRAPSKLFSRHCLPFVVVALAWRVRAERLAASGCLCPPQAVAVPRLIIIIHV